MESDMNSRIEYLYRDASNWKQYNEYIVSGSITEREIKPFLHDREYFIPGELGLKNLFPMPFGNDDHVWHEICSVEPTNDPPTVSFTAEELRHRLQVAAKNEWHEYNWSRQGYGKITCVLLWRNKNMTECDSFEDLNQDTWILLGYLKTCLNRLEEECKEASDDERSLRRIRFFHNTLFDAVKDILDATEEDGHRKNVQHDFARCAKECNGLLLLIAWKVEKLKETISSDTLSGIQAIRDRIYKAVEKVGG